LTQSLTQSLDSNSKRLKLPTTQTPNSPTRPVTAVPAANGFSTTCHTSPPASTTTPSTGTTSRVPL